MSAKAKEPQKRVNTYLPDSVVERVEAYKNSLEQNDPLGRPITMTDAIRVLLVDALNRAGK